MDFGGLRSVPYLPKRLTRRANVTRLSSRNSVYTNDRQTINICRSTCQVYKKREEEAFYLQTITFPTVLQGTLLGRLE